MCPRTMRPRNNALRYPLALLLTLWAGLAGALDEDAQQPIRISADQALRDEKQGITIYNGNVHMDQGSLQLRADRVTIYRIEEEADKIVATGAPAQMQQQPEPDQPPVTARAGIIEYYKLEERVRLRKGARLEQEGSTFTGESIDYYMADQRVRATSNADDESSRVEVVIPARVLTEEAADGAPEGQ